ncbi:MAG: UDP-N-acetylmuramoyl-L-alanine--D-glutamate ligase, partial [Pseudobdellovibrio sp.]
MNTSYLKNLAAPIAIIGLGKSGSSALNLLLAAGRTKEEIILFDEKSTSAEIKSPEKLAEKTPKTLVVSPGVPLKSPWIKSLVDSGAHLTSEITLAASLMTSEKLIGITGSVGKSTVTSVLGAGALAFDPHAFVGGNLGTPFCDYALKRLNGEPTAQWVILELSSYQLENCNFLKLENSIITYLSSNHLERYKDLSEYYHFKLKITEITKNICLFNKTSPDCVAHAPHAKSQFRLINAENFSHKSLLPELFLIGSHNKDNFALAAEMATICEWPETSFHEMTRYRGLSHRLEFVTTQNGVTYINDSKATAIDSVLVATKGCLEGLSSPNKLFLLLGGKDKNLPWEDLSVLNSNEIVNPVFFGACGELAREKSQLSGEYFEKLGSAINYCQRRAQPGDV